MKKVIFNYFKYKNYFLIEKNDLNTKVSDLPMIKLLVKE